MTEKDLKAEADAYVNSEKHSLRFGCKHEVWVQRTIDFRGEVVAQIDPVVRLANDDDGYYTQTFRNRSEVDAFIAELNAAADDAWGQQ